MTACAAQVGPMQSGSAACYFAAVALSVSLPLTYLCRTLSARSRLSMISCSSRSMKFSVSCLSFSLMILVLTKIQFVYFQLGSIVLSTTWPRRSARKTRHGRWSVRTGLEGVEVCVVCLHVAVKERVYFQLPCQREAVVRVGVRLFVDQRGGRIRCGVV
jgi:hypothetical protein